MSPCPSSGRCIFIILGKHSAVAVQQHSPSMISADKGSFGVKALQHKRMGRALES